ncbi:hypothetical protein I6F35_06975 [Bradyrhizobium sp. BRP22]|uniref:hypothetical protein n=1 Tax=Bradyrhizobium sp. BRP22 TaxID=2793821 RepID=UPI001CD810C5|nr:hypothetical protein [Bradyrhizobium sp. BRP22]MCA1452964.1 hypothetical protein [Bradyrhizobium sp. BRP22]
MRDPRPRLIANDVGRFFSLAGWCALLWCLQLNAVLSRDAAAGVEGTVWTAIIPDAFPRYVYTWRMSLDGSYREDGRDAASGRPIQATLSGRWSLDGARMILRQEGYPFVFDGVVVGNSYSGTLYLNDRSFSRFCAARGEKPPEHCGSGSGVAMMQERD